MAILAEAELILQGSQTVLRASSGRLLRGSLVYTGQGRLGKSAERHFVQRRCISPSQQCKERSESEAARVGWLKKRRACKVKGILVKIETPFTLPGDLQLCCDHCKLHSAAERSLLIPRSSIPLGYYYC